MADEPSVGSLDVDAARALITERIKTTREYILDYKNDPIIANSVNRARQALVVWESLASSLSGIAERKQDAERMPDAWAVIENGEIIITFVTQQEAHNWRYRRIGTPPTVPLYLAARRLSDPGTQEGA